MDTYTLKRPVTQEEMFGLMALEAVLAHVYVKGEQAHNLARGQTALAQVLSVLSDTKEKK